MSSSMSSETVDDLRALAFAFLTSQDVASNFPIIQDKLGIGRECGLGLFGFAA